MACFYCITLQPISKDCCLKMLPSQSAMKELTLCFFLFSVFLDHKMRELKKTRKKRLPTRGKRLRQSFKQ